MGRAGLILRKFQKGRSRPIEINDEQCEETTLSVSDFRQEQKHVVSTIELLDDDDYSVNSNGSSTSSANVKKPKLFY